MTHKKVIVSKEILNCTTDFLRQQGKKGFEGRVYWVGSDTESNSNISKIIIPEQIPRRTIYGVSVTVSQQANIAAARELKDGEYIIAKVHSHPGRAYNSDVDKANPFLRHEGALSIIVPNFGVKGMTNLSHCVVCLFKNYQWNDLSERDIKSLFTFN